jgi:hypothetical protein
VRYADGTRPAGLVCHYRACRNNVVFCKSTAVDFRHMSSMRVSRGVTGDLPVGFVRHVPGGLVFWDRSRAFSRMLLLPARGDAFDCKLSLPR